MITVGKSDIVIPFTDTLIEVEGPSDMLAYVKCMRAYMPDLVKNVIYHVRKKTGVDPTRYNCYSLLPYAFMLPALLENPASITHYTYGDDDMRHFNPDPEFVKDMKRILSYIILTGPEFDSVRYLWKK